MCVAQAREKYKHGMLCINATDEKKQKKEKKNQNQVQKTSTAPLFLPLFHLLASFL